MADDSGSPDRLAPDEAFAVLGNETRLSILRGLAGADETLSFSDLYDRVDVDDTGQFNYHLGELTGHFVRKQGDGYVLARPGRRIVEAVLSGAVTEEPEMERTGVDRPCEHCGAPIEVRWNAGSVELYCTDCAGRWGESRGGSPRGGEADEGYLGRYPLPPAGLRDRDPDAVLRTAWTWTTLEVMACGSGICPRCSAPVDAEPYVCEAHDPGDGICPNCERAHRVAVVYRCTNCIFSTGGGAALAVMGHPAMLGFLLDNGLDPVATPDTGRVEAVHEEYEETVLSTEPFEARFTFDIDGERLTLRVDDDLEVVEATRGE